MPFWQTSGSSLVNVAVSLEPMVKMMASTSVPLEANRTLVTAVVS